jgi:tripartite-type tricarboxylate transporter receptor subunit TctC
MTCDPLRELAPVSLVATVPDVPVAAPGVPVRDPASLAAHARANPNKLSYASSGNGVTASRYDADTGALEPF